MLDKSILIKPGILNIEKETEYLYKKNFFALNNINDKV